MEFSKNLGGLQPPPRPLPGFYGPEPDILNKDRNILQ